MPVPVRVSFPFSSFSLLFDSVSQCVRVCVCLCVNRKCRKIRGKRGKKQTNHRTPLWLLVHAAPLNSLLYAVYHIIFVSWAHFFVFRIYLSWIHIISILAYFAIDESGITKHCCSSASTQCTQRIHTSTA